MKKKKTVLIVIFCFLVHSCEDLSLSDLYSCVTRLKSHTGLHHAKEAKFAKNFCVPTLAASLFQHSNVRNYPAHFGVSVTHFCNAAKRFLTQETAGNVL